jgi:Xaa-Pro aminopeptidase
LKEIGQALKPVDDLVGRIWDSNGRPAENQNPIVAHDILYAGENVSQKLNRTASEIRGAGATTAVISALDEVAWLFNLRGADIPYNPFFKSYAIIHANYEVDQPELFVNLAQLSSDIYPPGVRIESYSMFWSRLNETAANPTVGKILASAKVSQAILTSIPDDKRLLPLPNSPVQRVKARKNSIERKGMQDCQIRDGVARMKHLGWLEQQINDGKIINETESSDQLLIYQKQQSLFQFPSFSAISASGDRAAVIHYSAEAATARRITKNEVYLLDVSVNISSVYYTTEIFFSRLVVNILIVQQI